MRGRSGSVLGLEKDRLDNDLSASLSHLAAVERPAASALLCDNADGVSRGRGSDSSTVSACLPSDLLRDRIESQRLDIVPGTGS